MKFQAIINIKLSTLFYLKKICFYFIKNTILQHQITFKNLKTWQASTLYQKLIYKK
jgi:hypothetical protein